MKSIICTILLMFCTLSKAATPIDGLYTHALGGYAYLPNNVNHSYGTNTLNQVSYEAGYDAGGSIGFKSNPLRYEAEVTYLHANPEHFSLSGTQQTTTSGYTQGVLALANIYYDFGRNYALLQPFLGGGIGYGWLQTHLDSTAPSVVNFSADNSDLAYQGIAGITFNFAENYALDLTYRYVATSHLGNFGTIFQAQLVNIGATYRFDIARYK